MNWRASTAECRMVVNRAGTAAEKCGSNGPQRVFRALVKKVCRHDAEHGHFPDYAVTMADDVIRAVHSSLKGEPETLQDNSDVPYIDAEAMRDAKTAAPGYDIYALANGWPGGTYEAGLTLKNPCWCLHRLCKKKRERKPLR